MNPPTQTDPHMRCRVKLRSGTTWESRVLAVRPHENGVDLLFEKHDDLSAVFLKTDIELVEVWPE